MFAADQVPVSPPSSSSQGELHSERRPAEGRPAAPLLDVRDLHVTYAGAVRALHGVSVAVPEGAVVAVLGNNGAGKSTLLRAISGTLPLVGGRSAAGSISFDGQRIDRRDPATIVRAGLVQVPEGRRIFTHLSVEENLRAAALVSRDRRARARARARVYDLFPVLADRRSRPGGLLSGGEQQMLAIGRALMASPRLLLLDEPSLGLAPQLVRQIAAVIREINSQGTSVLVVEQHIAIALEVADQAYVLEVGRVSLEGPAAELAGSEEVRHRYLGESGADLSPDRRSRPRIMPDATDSERALPSPRHLRVEGVSVAFGGLQALSDVSFTIEPGTVHALIGPNGAGKSTCLNVLTGVYPATAGRVWFGEQDLIGLRPRQIVRLGVSRTFQNIAVSPAASVADNLMLGRHRLTRSGVVAYGCGLPRAAREHHRQLTRVTEIADLVGLGDRLDVAVRSLAYGDLKKVELGRALCAEPALLLLDEPVSGMSVTEAQEMAQVISDVQVALGISILVVEHNMTFVMRLASRVTVLDFGRWIAEGSPQEIQRDPEVLRAYLGSDDDIPPRRPPPTEEIR